MLLRRGARVTLVDAWGPGNSRASSGGETRVIRGVYGKDRIYTAMARRAFELWHENEARWKKTLYTRTGALWMVADSGEFVRSSIPFLREFGFAYEEISAAEARGRYPQVDFAGIEWTLLEKEAGYLLARRSCADVLEGFLSEGGAYREAMAVPGEIAGGRLTGVALSDGTRLAADVYVFACGPWLPKLFPDVIGSRIEPTRQEVFYFGTPGGDARFSERQMPVWVETPRFFYGIPGNERRGFKIADDARAAFDPTSGDRTPSPTDSGPRGSTWPAGFRRCGRATARVASLSVRELARSALHRRPPSRSRERLARGRRLGPRLQARPSPRRARRGQRARGKADGADFLLVSLRDSARQNFPPIETSIPRSRL